MALRSSSVLPLLLLLLVSSLALHTAVVTALECSGAACDVCGAGSCTTKDGSTDLSCVPQAGEEGLATLPCNYTPSAGTDGFNIADFSGNAIASIGADDFNATALSVLQTLRLNRTLCSLTEVAVETKKKTVPLFFPLSLSLSHYLPTALAVCSLRLNNFCPKRKMTDSLSNDAESYLHHDVFQTSRVCSLGPYPLCSSAGFPVSYAHSSANQYTSAHAHTPSTVSCIHAV